MALFTHPAGGGSISHGGITYPMDDDGIIEVPHNAPASLIEALTIFGYVAHVPEDFKEEATGETPSEFLANLATAKKSDLIAFLDNQGIEIPEGAKIADLRALVENALVPPLKTPAPGESLGSSAGDPNQQA